MDVTRGDRVLGVRGDIYTIDNDTPDARGWVTGIGESGTRYPLNPENLRPAPPDVVTLTLSYRGHEVSEGVSVDAWRDVAGRFQSVHPIGTPLIDACRALAEKVDGKENPDG